MSKIERRRDRERIEVHEYNAYMFLCPIQLPYSSVTISVEDI